jgi:hypothetical protein
MDDPTRPSTETRDAEREDAQRAAGADRMPADDEERRADAAEVDPEVAEHGLEMLDLGANQEGEGRIP